MDMKTTTTRRAELVALRAMKVDGIRNATALRNLGGAERSRITYLEVAVAHLESEIEAIDAALATERVGRL
jgi:hypothetical protein